ncbi:MAG: TolC family protein [Bacteroidetes bacterium]|nr:TolC family protein [Candidatus Colenecus caballi]
MKRLKFLSVLLLLASGPKTQAQEQFTLKECFDYAIEHNQSLQKDRLGLETAAQSKRELIGSLLPQINASAGFTYNIDKPLVTMPNFISPMMGAMAPAGLPDYIAMTMSLDMSANWGASLTQQIVNLSLLNALKVTEATGEMAQIGIEATTNDIIAQTATFYYNVQVLQYAMTQFDESIALMDTTLNMMQVNREIGLVRQIDVDRITVAKTNLETQKSSMLQALEVQKNLLKLQMGFPMTEAIIIPEINLDEMENRLQTAASPGFDITVLPAYRILEQQKNLAGLQYKSALYETLPVLVLAANYSYNYTGNDFSGPSYHSFPVSMVSLNLKMPLFTGMSKNAKIKKAKIEMMKTDGDRETLEQSLTMAHSNARMQLEQQIRTIEAQRRNKDLAQEVFNVTEFNYGEGISSLSDVLNATSSLIEAQMNYVNALSSCMSAYIELKKTDGTIGEINQ